MRQIPISGGRDISFVSDEDFEKVSRHSWCLLLGGGRRQRKYAQANIKTDGVWKRTLLHRFILDATPNQKIDHRDGNGLNNQRSNLRFASRGQNQHNSSRRMYKGSRSSVYKGVHWSKECSKWIAQITCNRKHYYLGLFVNEREAAIAYDRKARELHGEFAKVNFP